MFKGDINTHTHTHTQMSECMYEKERCIVSRNLPCHKTTERTRNIQNTYMNVRTCLWGGEVHGFPKPSPSQDNQMHKGDTKTHTKVQPLLWAGEVHGFPKPSPSQDVRTHNKDTNTHTHTQKSERLYEEERCMVSRNLPRHKPSERTTKRQTHKYIVLKVNTYG